MTTDSSISPLTAFVADLFISELKFRNKLDYFKLIICEIVCRRANQTSAEFKYLGSLVQQKKVASAAEIHSRIGQAAATFTSLRWCI